MRYLLVLRYAEKGGTWDQGPGIAEQISSGPVPGSQSRSCELSGVMTIFWLGLAGVAISGYVLYKPVTDGPVVCLGSGCATVIPSGYGRLLGIPNRALGAHFFTALTPSTPLGV